jgi:hypothetical protein
VRGSSILSRVFAVSLLPYPSPPPKKSIESSTLHIVIPILSGKNVYSIVVEPCSQLVHLGEKSGRAEVGELDTYSMDRLETVKVMKHQAFVFLASCGHAGGKPGTQYNMPFDLDSRSTEEISQMFGFKNGGTENYVDLSLHIDVQDMLHQESFSSILIAKGVTQRPLIPRPDDDPKTKAKADRVAPHRQLLRQDMVDNPTTIENCSEYSGSSFKPHFVVESQQEIERLCDLTHQPSSMWVQAVQRYTAPGFSTNFGKRHFPSMQKTPPRKSPRRS